MLGIEKKTYIYLPDFEGVTVYWRHEQGGAGIEMKSNNTNTIQ